MTRIPRRTVLAAAPSAIAWAAMPAYADKKYDAGATDTEIKIGNTNPYSGPASSYSVVGKTEAAFFRMINEQGGINGRKITFISYDDGYSPPTRHPGIDPMPPMISPTRNDTDNRKLKLSGATNCTTIAPSAPAMPVNMALTPKVRVL